MSKICLAVFSRKKSFHLFLAQKVGNSMVFAMLSFENYVQTASSSDVSQGEHEVQVTGDELEAQGTTGRK